MERIHGPCESLNLFFIYWDKLWRADGVLDEASRIITGFREDVTLGKSQIAKSRVERPGKGLPAPASRGLPGLGAPGVVAGSRLSFAGSGCQLSGMRRLSWDSFRFWMALLL